MKDETKGGVGSLLIVGVMLLVICNMLNPGASKEAVKEVKKEIRTVTYRIKPTVGSKVMEGVTDAVSDLLTIFEED